MFESILLWIFTPFIVAYRVLWFAWNIIHFFGKAEDENHPDGTVKYTRYVFYMHPFEEIRVWQHVIGPLYVRIPYSWAKQCEKCKMKVPHLHG